MTTTKLWNITWFLTWSLLMFNSLTTSWIYRMEISEWINQTGVHAVGLGIVILCIVTAITAIRELNR